jgi:tetratricopeptide (TPR) repeat protein
MGRRVLSVTADVLQTALAHHQAARLDDAEALYRSLLADDPENAEALNLLGVLIDARGDSEQGAALIAQAIAVRDHPRFHNNLGMALGRLGRHQAALDVFAAALAQWPDYPQALNNQGAAQEALGRLEDAAASFRASVDARPDYAKAWGNLGTALRGLNRPEEAVAAYERALALNPEASAFLAGHGAALLSLRRAAEAEPVLARAAALAPERPETWRDLAVARRKLGRLDEAEVACREALLLRPDFPEALDVLGNTLRELGRLEEAEAVQRRLAAMCPASALAYRNLSMTLEEQKRHHEAMALLDLAIGLAPNDADARHHRALMLLRQGRLTEGWTDHEARFHTTQGRPNQREFSVPQWRGEQLDGQTILLHAEQGFGDTIQFVRYAPMVAARGGRVLLWVPSRLRRLLSNVPGVSAMLPSAAGDADPARLASDRPDMARAEFDLHCPLMSLPLIFGTTLDAIPSSCPYLQPAAEVLQRWRQLLPSIAERRVGIAWAGNPQHPNDRQRSVPFAALSALWTVPRVRWVSLQVGARAEDLRQLPAGAVDDFAAEQADFADTAAALNRLDLVVAADTAVAHLAGACGIPVWTMLMFTADWRWLSKGDTTPWYPTMRLFRQAEDRAWEPVVHRIAEALSA